MKKALIILLSLGLISSTVKNDSLTYDNLNINGVLLHQTTNSIIEKIGNPDTISNYENEKDNETWKEYRYKGNSFYRYENKWVSFELRNEQFYFYKPEIKVGNDIDRVQPFFPSSYKNKKTENGLGFIIIDIELTKNEKSDAFVVINYNASTNRISSIHLGSK
jgi:hypothetical protein